MRWRQAIADRLSTAHARSDLPVASAPESATVAAHTSNDVAGNDATPVHCAWSDTLLDERSSSPIAPHAYAIQVRSRSDIYAQLIHTTLQFRDAS